jgi:dephospho-CoA kinase
VLTVALTGGIGSGKSLAGNYFSQFGATVVDFDQLARAVVERGSIGFDEVVARFGDDILNNGDIDRKKLGEIIFSDLNAKGDLEAITHPKIRQAFEDVVSSCGPEEILIAEIPLLAESKNSYSFDYVITVSANIELRRARLLERGLKNYQISERMTAQASDDEREAIADFVIINEGTPEELLRNVENLYDNRLYPMRTGI